MKFTTTTTMTMTAASAFLFQSVRGFTPLLAAGRRAATATATAANRLSSVRFMSSDDSSSKPTPPMPHDDDKMPYYALGVNLALQVGGQGNIKTLLESDELDLVLEGFCDSLKGEMTVESRDVLGTYGPKLNEILQSRSSLITERVKQEGTDFIQNFLDCNEEAEQKESGLVYCPMKEGEGAQPTLQSTVEVHYHGTLTDGTVFDSSVDRGQTISFPLGGVIRGWQEGLQLMKEGGKATLLCPPDIAYGEQGSGEVIPPGATLKFEVELFKVTNN